MNFSLLQVDACVSKGKGGIKRVCVVCAFSGIPTVHTVRYFLHQLTVLLTAAHEMSSECFSKD